MFRKKDIAYYYDPKSKMGICRARILDVNPETCTVKVKLKLLNNPEDTPRIVKNVEPTTLYDSYELAVQTSRLNILLQNLPDNLKTQYSSEILDGIDNEDKLILWLYQLITDPDRQAIAAYVIENTTGMDPTK